MTGTLEIEADNSSSKIETLHVHSGKSAEARVKVVSYKDKETNNYVYYIPSLSLSAYGESKKDASKMMNSVVKEFLAYLVEQPQKIADKELAALGWKKDRLRTKDFSKTYVDVSGELKEFSIEEIETEDVVYG